MENQIHLISSGQDNIMEKDPLAIDPLSDASSKSKDTSAGRMNKVTKYVQCPHCPETVKGDASFRYHRIRFHLPEIFADCWDKRKMSEDRFGVAVERCLLQQTMRHPLPRTTGCLHCGTTYKNKKDMNCHLVQEHFEVIKSVLKDMLNGGTKHPSSVFPSPPPKIAKESEATSKEIKCPQCNQSFTNLAQRRQHVWRQHNKKKRYDCPECRLSFTDPRQQRKHLLDVHLLALFKDCQVDDKFPQKTLKEVEVLLRCMLTKMAIATGSKTRYECRFCQMQYTDPNYMSFHLIDNHRHELVSQVADGESGSSEPAAGGGDVVNVEEFIEGNTIIKRETEGDSDIMIVPD